MEYFWMLLGVSLLVSPIVICNYLNERRKMAALGHEKDQVTDRWVKGN